MSKSIGSRLIPGAKWLSVVRRRGLWFVLVVSIALGLLVLGGVVTVKRWLAERHLQAAEHDISLRDCHGALLHVERCLELRPDYARGHFVAARIARRCKKY